MRVPHFPRLTVAAALAVSASPAWCLYVNPAAPAGFSGAPGQWTYQPPSPTQQLNSIIRGPGPSISLGSAGTVQRPMAMRLASTASRVLGRALWANPALAVGVGIAAWLAEECIGMTNGKWTIACTDIPLEVPGKAYHTAYTDAAGLAPFRSRAAACSASAGFIASYRQSHAHYSWSGPVYVSSRGCEITGTHPDVQEPLRMVTAVWEFDHNWGVEAPEPKILTEEEMGEVLAPKALPEILPPIKYPVQSPPVWNPTDDPENPKTQPLRVPAGEPVPVPGTSPQTYRQPVTDVRHSPTAENPWRFDVAPGTVTVTTGLNGPTDMPSEGSGLPALPQAEPSEKGPGLCTEFPDILACQKMGTIEAAPVINRNVPLAITPDSGFPSGGTCPAPRTFTTQGQTYSLSMQPICDFAVAVRPLVIGFAWLSASMIFFGIARRES